VHRVGLSVALNLREGVGEAEKDALADTLVLNDPVLLALGEAKRALGEAHGVAVGVVEVHPLREREGVGLEEGDTVCVEVRHREGDTVVVALGQGVEEGEWEAETVRGDELGQGVVVCERDAQVVAVEVAHWLSLREVLGEEDSEGERVGEREVQGEGDGESEAVAQGVAVREPVLEGVCEGVGVAQAEAPLVGDV
jgi:hypothetical protein